MKSKGLVVLLGLTLGLLGAHRFYLGQTAWGWAYLVATLFSIMFLVFGIGFISMGVVGAMVLVDIFGFLVMSEEKFDMKYNNKVRIQ